jgi:hypothetical protein
VNSIASSIARGWTANNSGSFGQPEQRTFEPRAEQPAARAVGAVGSITGRTIEGDAAVRILAGEI